MITKPVVSVVKSSAPLHLRRVRNLVALLTSIYVAAAILPWTALFLTL